MLRIVSTAIRGLAARTSVANFTNSLVTNQFPVAQYAQQRFFGAFSSTIDRTNYVSDNKQRKIFGLSEINSVVPTTLAPATTSVRTLIRYSRNKGKRKTVKAVVKRFYRLNWGIWIRTIAGRHNHLWKKTLKRRRRGRQHVFCNSTQSTLLDKMVSKYWRRPHYYVDDPYNPYHNRPEFPITRKKPQPY